MTDDSKSLTNADPAMTNFEFDWANDLPMAIGIFETENQRFVAANPAGLSLFGWTSADVGVTSLWDIVAEVDWSLLHMEVARSTNAQEEIFLPASGFLTFQRKDSTKFSGWFQAKDLPNTSGKVRYRVAMVFPIDESQSAEIYNELKSKKDQQDIIALFSGTTAHEVNNALAVVFGLLEKVEIPSEDLTTMLKSLEKIKRIGNVLNEAGSQGFKIQAFEAYEPDENFIDQHSRDNTTGSILLVDDHPELLEVLHDLLHNAGYTVVKTNNLQDARARTKVTRFDFAIVDVQLGSELGTDFAFELQQTSPSTKIILMSGFSRHFERYKDTPEMTFLRKPFGMSVLMSALATAGRK